MCQKVSIYLLSSLQSSDFSSEHVDGILQSGNIAFHRADFVVIRSDLTLGVCKIGGTYSEGDQWTLWDSN